MPEFSFGKFEHVVDAFLAEKLDVVVAGLVEKIVGTDAEPKEVDLAVGLFGMVIDVWQLGRGERTVRAKIRELVEIHQSIAQCLIASTRESTYRTMFGIVDGEVVGLDIRHEVIDEIIAEQVHSKVGWLIH